VPHILITHFKSNPMDRNLTLGQPCQIDHYLVRRSTFNGNAGWLKFWETVPLKEPKAGLVMGVRNLSNGKNDSWGDGVVIYNPKDRFRALLVATDLHRKPVLVKFIL
jgi:hypothetical protein